MGGSPSASLAIAVARGGGLGMVSGSAGAEALRQQIDQIPSDLPVGVNFIVPFLDLSSLEEAAERTRYVELFWGAPNEDKVRVIHQGGALAGWQVGTSDDAVKAEQAGCDIVIVQGTEAGGHVCGTVGLFALLEETIERVDVPILASGGVGTGRTMAAALVAGAQGVRVGTRFLAASESFAHSRYVDALIKATAEDTVLTTAFGDGWPDAPHRVLRSSIEAGESRGQDQVWSPMWPTEEFVGPVEAAALYAGQSVGAVNGRQPAAEIVAELVSEAERLLER
jgi:nitronate monooxygenase